MTQRRDEPVQLPRGVSLARLDAAYLVDQVKQPVHATVRVLKQVLEGKLSVLVRRSRAADRDRNVQQPRVFRLDHIDAR